MLEWNVYIEDFNSREIKTYNIFNHGYFLQDCKEIAEEYKNKNDFETKINKSLMYYFWSQCEWEIILSDWPPSEKFHNKKVDVYSQIKLPTGLSH